MSYELCEISHVEEALGSIPAPYRAKLDSYPMPPNLSLISHNISFITHAPCLIPLSIRHQPHDIVRSLEVYRQFLCISFERPRILDSIQK